jgi:antitoxin VapB
LRDEIEEIATRCAALPVLDARQPDDIIGYDQHGIPR